MLHTSEVARPHHIPQPQQEPYRVRLAQESELEKVFRLRYDVFYTEMGAQGAGADTLKLDIDEHDQWCDHLVVSSGEQIVGTYRLLPLSRMKKAKLKPYSDSEFDMSSLLRTFGDANLLELGRSCIHPDHRNGQTARLLWAGIAEYFVAQDIKALFGCVSVHGISGVQALRLAESFRKEGHWHSALDLPVRAPFRNAEIEVDGVAMVPLNPRALLPPLLKGYLNVGAKICGGPAWDEAFHCQDFLMLLESDCLSPRYYKGLIEPLVRQGRVGRMRL